MKLTSLKHIEKINEEDLVFVNGGLVLAITIHVAMTHSETILLDKTEEEWTKKSCHLNNQITSL